MSTRPTCSGRVSRRFVVKDAGLQAPSFSPRLFFILAEVLRRQEELRRMEEFTQERQKRKEMQLR